MIALNNSSWYDQEIPNREDELGYSRIATADRNPDDDFDDDDDLDTEADGDDDLNTTYDTEADDDLYEDEDEEEEDDDDDDDDATAHNTEFVNDVDSDNLPGQEDNSEIPEQEESDNEKSGYPHETEVEQQDQGDGASYSEQTDVSPPRPHEFPSEGNARTDFASRNQGRTTGRMIGHEPGTEGI